ncbi:[protein-PII] uridylyltransferase [Thermodesulfobacteriota bacterium]
MKVKEKTSSDTLYEKQQRLIANFLKNREPAFLDKHTRIVDEYFQDVFEKSIVGPSMGLDKNPYAIIALGGYGRREQCIHSDIDLLFLFQKRVPAQAKDIIQEIVYPLWDLGLDVSPATRSMKECLNLASKDFDILTPLLDARFICGMSFLYSELMERLHSKTIPNRSKKMIDWLIEMNSERQERFGDSSYLLEPNLKEGEGGLRDYHTLLWIARIQANLKERKDLEYYGYLSNDEYLALSKALSFIWNVRNRLHHAAGRKCDQLHIEYQQELASSLKFKQFNGQAPVERFLGELHAQMEFIKQRHQIFLYELRHTRRGRPGRKPVKKAKISNLEVNRGMLRFTSIEKILKSPELLIKIFAESARLEIPLSPEAQRTVKELGFLIDDEFKKSPSNLKMFERILVSPKDTFNVLNEMLNTEFLVRFIPEFKTVTHRIQYNQYHIYPVDKHLLRTVQAIKQFGTAVENQSDYLWGKIYQELENPKLLFWAALLHDIGKGDPGPGHSVSGARIVGSILAEKGFDPEEVETVSFLVREHLFLIKTATRRDINDEETAIFCARRIKNIGWLKMLYLLTVADSLATGPKAWNEWMSILLGDLFLKVLNILEKGELASREAVEAVEHKKEEILNIADLRIRQDLEELFMVMSPRYLLYTAGADILKHSALYGRLGEGDFTWEIKEITDADTRNLTICAKDRPGLFSKIAGTLTLNSVDILDAQVYTWKNNVALDIFKVEPPPDRLFENEIWERAKQHLSAALSGKMDLGAELHKKKPAFKSSKKYTMDRPHRVVVDNHSSSFFTIVEVFTYDFPGLLFRVTDALFRCELDIRIAKIATKIDQVVDVFYVRDLYGQKVDSADQVSVIKSKILEVLPG